MESPPSNFVEAHANAAQRKANSLVWHEFYQRPRQVVTVPARVDDEIFWRKISELAGLVGPEPLLMISLQAEVGTLRRFLFSAPGDRPSLKVELKARANHNGVYVATVENIDVYGANCSPGTSWLFSAKALRSVRYASIDEEGRFVTLKFELGEGLKGTLRACFSRSAVWAGTPTFEVRLADPDKV